MSALTAPLIQRQQQQQQLETTRQDSRDAATAAEEVGERAEETEKAEATGQQVGAQVRSDSEEEEAEDEEMRLDEELAVEEDHCGQLDQSLEGGFGLRASRSRSAAAFEAAAATVSRRRSPASSASPDHRSSNDCLNLIKPIPQASRAGQVNATKPNSRQPAAHKQVAASSMAPVATGGGGGGGSSSSSKLMDPQQMHVCRLCDKLLSSSSSLDRHMLTHSGERPFVCKRCHMTFTTNGNMHRHMRTHLHKDSLARQQHEQQLKSLVNKAQIQQAPASQAPTLVSRPTGVGALIAGTTSPSESANCHSGQQQQQLAPFAAGQFQSLIGGDSLATVAAPSSSALALAAAVAASPGGNRSAAPFQPLGKQVSQRQQLGANAAAVGQQQNSVTALINQQLVAAFKQQQQQQLKAADRELANEQLDTTPDSLAKSFPASLLATAVGQQQQQSMAAESEAAKYLRRLSQQLDPKSIMLGALQGDQLGFESVKAVMLAAAAAAAAAAVNQQRQLEQPFGAGDARSNKLQDEELEGGDEDANRGRTNEDFLSLEALQERQHRLNQQQQQQQQRIRGKRRKQVNPRSTRAHPATSSSLNSGDDADEDTDDNNELDGLHQVNKLAASPTTTTTTTTTSTSTSTSNSTSMVVKRARRSSSTISDEVDESQASFRKEFVDFSSIKKNDTDDGDSVDLGDSSMISSANKLIETSQVNSILKRDEEDEEIEEDFNNNQGEQFASKKVDMDLELDVDDDADLELPETKTRKTRRQADKRQQQQQFTALRLNDLSEMSSDEEQDDTSLNSDVNMNLSDNNTSSSDRMSFAPFADGISSATDKRDRMEAKNGLSSAGNLANHFQANQSARDVHLTDTNPAKTIPLTNVEGEVIEDISQSYVKTANPNAARKGGKRNRHCYKCKLCTYSSVDRCTLVRHLRIHSGERPYICGICRYAFTTKANCERHVRKRHKKQYNSLGGAGGGGIKGSNGGGRSLIITDHSNHQTIPVKVNPVAAQTISQTLQRIQEKQQNSADDDEQLSVDNIERINNNSHHQRHQHRHQHQNQQQQQHQATGQTTQQQQSAAGLAGAQRSLLSSSSTHLSQQFSQLRNLNSQTPFFIRRNPFDPFNPIDLAAQALDLSCKFQSK